MANKVIVQHVLGNGGKMLVDQACHKSVHHAAVLFGIDPVYLPASVNPRYGFYGPVARQRVFDAASMRIRMRSSWCSPPAPTTASTTTWRRSSSARTRRA
jgi:arginine/lysine/ornithine decarboxylase